jgi:hypothetical protein
MSPRASEEPKLTGGDDTQLTINYDTSDPVQYKARIMEIDHEKARMVVAEETIFVIDFMMGETRFATAVKDGKGKPKPLASFKQGDIVYVQGFKNADGVIFASLVQKVKSPKVKKESSKTHVNEGKRKK